jgi:hypothetical protein
MPSSAMASRNKMSDISLLQLSQRDQAASNVNNPSSVILRLRRTQSSIPLFSAMVRTLNVT